MLIAYAHIRVPILVVVFQVPVVFQNLNWSGDSRLTAIR